MVHSYRFGVFSFSTKYYFQVSLNLKVILYVAKVTKNTRDWAPLALQDVMIQ